MKTLNNTKFEILTEDGFKDFRGLKESSHEEYLELIFDDTSYKCSKTHLIKVNGDWVQAKDLKIGLVNNKVLKEIKTIKNNNDKFWDPIGIKDTKSFISKGLIHHNCDEAAYIPKNLWEEFVDSVMPTMSSLIFKQVITTSTANGVNHFEKLVKQAKAGISGDKFVETSWRNVPHYDKKGNLLDPEEYKKITIAKYGKKFFNQTEECQFIGSSDTLISGDSLANILNNIEKAEVIPQTILNEGTMYQTVKEGNSYVLTVDAAKDGIDAFSVQVVNITKFPFKQVFTANLQVDYLMMPLHLVELGNYYNQALMVIENNEGAGQSIADQLWTIYEYENLYKDKNINKVGLKKYPGFRTTTKSRPLILNMLKIFIEEGKLEIQNQETLNQLYTFTKRKNGNKYEAESGYHDDLVLSLAMIFAPFMEIKVFDNFELFTKQLRIENSETLTVDFLSVLDVGFSSDDEEDPYKEQRALLRDQGDTDYSPVLPTAPRWD